MQTDRWEWDYGHLTHGRLEFPIWIAWDNGCVDYIDQGASVDFAGCVGWKRADPPAHPHDEAALAQQAGAVEPRFEFIHCACDNEPDAHTLRLHIGNQSFTINSGAGYETREDAEWTANQLRNALRRLASSAPGGGGEVGK